MTSPTEAVHMTITPDDALRALRAVVAEKGADYVYKSPAEGPTGTCVYVWDVAGQLQPQCIVGCALHHLGVPLELMAQGETNSINVHALAANLAQKGYVIEPDAQLIFRSAQIVQDSALLRKSAEFCGCESCQEKGDATWGAALARAEEWAAKNLPRAEVSTADDVHAGTDEATTTTE